jgi:hypothetical protein
MNGVLSIGDGVAHRYVDGGGDIRRGGTGAVGCRLVVGGINHLVGIDTALAGAAESCGAKEAAAVNKTNSFTGDQVSGERAADESGGVIGGGTCDNPAGGVSGKTWQLYPMR